MKIRLLLLIGIFGLLVYSCKMPGGDSANYPTREFWAQDTIDNSYYQVTAELLYRGVYCTIWAERGSGVTASTAQAVGREYDTTIYPKMIDAFGDKYLVPLANGVTVEFNTMEQADLDGDRDGKLCILLLDIKDSYQNANDGYVEGYFADGNFSSKSQNPYSNECDMIYVDTNPGDPGSPTSNQTLAHEMQHLMNHVTSSKKRAKSIDLWINEGLSCAAEWVCFGGHSGRLANYNDNPSGLLGKGNNFFTWDNRTTESPIANLDDYSTAYLFFQWLRLQSGGTAIYKDIITSNHVDHQAVTTAANKFMPDQGYSDWAVLLKTWLAANYIQANTGPYGYRGDSALNNNITRHFAPAGQTNISLYPGEGLFSKTATAIPMPSQGTHIRYAGLSASGEVSDTLTFVNGVLLTYNVDPNIYGDTEDGTTTGLASVGMSAYGMPTGPYKICWTSMLMQNESMQVVINE